MGDLSIEIREQINKLKDLIEKDASKEIIKAEQKKLNQMLEEYSKE